MRAPRWKRIVGHVIYYGILLLIGVVFAGAMALSRYRFNVWID